MSTRDTMTFAGAHDLAAVIRAYWSNEGHQIETWVEDITADNDGRGRVYCVRSDLVNGLPAT